MALNRYLSPFATLLLIAVPLTESVPIQCTSSRLKPQWPTFHPFNAVTRDSSGNLHMQHLNDGHCLYSLDSFLADVYIRLFF